MNRLVARILALVMFLSALVAAPAANAADFVNNEKPAGNSSTLNLVSFSPDRVNSGSTYDFLINGSPTTVFTFYGCFANSTDGVVSSIIPGSNIWAGGIGAPATNTTDEKIVLGLHMWYASDSTVPADCSWVDSANPDLETFVTILPSNITCEPVVFQGEGVRNALGSVEYDVLQTNAEIFTGYDDYFWFDIQRSQTQASIKFISDVYEIGVSTIFNTDGGDFNDVPSVEFLSATGERLGYREYIALDMSETLIFDEPVSEVEMNFTSEGEFAGVLIGLCVFVDSNIDECAPAFAEEGNYTFVEFPAGVECEWTIPDDVELVDYVVVGGGAGGGGGSVRNAVACSISDTSAHPRFGGGGAGGAGGLVVEGTRSVSPGDTLTIRVGAGGDGGSGGFCPVGSVGTAGGAGQPGESSWIADLTYAEGGNGGEGGYSDGRAGSQGGSNASFNGGSATYLSGDCSNTTTTDCWAAPGGAGAGEDGHSVQTATPFTSTFGGDGGDGLYVEFLDEYFGGGGAGNIRHCFSNPNGTRSSGTGGLGGGGGEPGVVGGDTCVGLSHDGIDGYGGGGSGGRGNGSTAANNSNARAGGNGGDGAVIMRYLTPSAEEVVLDVTPGNTTMNNSEIEWSISSGASQITGYLVKLNGQLVAELDADALSYVLSGLEKNTLYSVEIIPVTEDGEIAGFGYTFHTPNEIFFKVRFDSNSQKLGEANKKLISNRLRVLGENDSNVKITVKGSVNYRAPVNYAIKQLAIKRAVRVGNFITSISGIQVRTKWSAPKGQNYQTHRFARVVITYTPAIVV